MKAGQQIGVVSSKAYPDRTVGFDGYVVLPVCACVVDDKHRNRWEDKVAKTRLLDRSTKRHVATLECQRGSFAVRPGKISLVDDPKGLPYDVELRARANGSFAIFILGMKIETTARL